MNDALHTVLELAIVVLSVGSAVLAYLRLRGRDFGLTDLLIFGALAGAADWAVYRLFAAVAGPHADSAAYEALAALLALFALVPLAGGLSAVALAALWVCAWRHAGVRLGLMLALAAAALTHWSGWEGPSPASPEARANPRTEGEVWALENGAASRDDCDRQSRSKAFREGCYARVGR